MLTSISSLPDLRPAIANSELSLHDANEVNLKSLLVYARSIFTTTQFAETFFNESSFGEAATRSFVIQT